jgi:hypothetical protein
MRLTIPSIVLCFVFTLCMTRTSRAETKTGDVTLTSNPSAEISLGTKVKLTCNFYTATVHGASGIWISANLQNVSADPMYCSCGVAFFDADGKLVACSTQAKDLSPLKPGAKTQLGSINVLVPATEIAKIKSFQVVWFETKNQADL